MFNLIAIWYVTDKFYHQKQEHNQVIEFHTEPKKPREIPRPEIIKPVEEQPRPIPRPISNRLMIKADNQGHDRGMALINNVPMPFLIDTGATMTTIPMNMAILAELPQGKRSETNTANGTAVNLVTQLKSIKIGNIEFRNIEASIVYNLKEVLIGMNMLKHFNVSVENNTMILASTDNRSRVVGSQPEESAPQRIKKNWKKTITCNGSDCKTKYSSE